MLKRYWIFWLILSVVFLAFAQEEEEEEEEPQVGALYTKHGIVVVSNKGEDYIVFELLGENPKLLKDGGNYFVNFNGHGVQFNIIPFSDFLSPEEIKKGNDPDILQKYADFELKYFEESANIRLDVKTERKKSKKGKPLLIWSFTMPEQTKNVTKQLFMAVALSKKVLGLNGIVVKSEDYANIYNILEHAMNSLQVRNTPVDPNVINDSLKTLK